MIPSHRAPSHRAVLGLCVGLWVILVAAAMLRAEADGPQWGVQVALTADDRSVATALKPTGTAWLGGVRAQNEIVSIDGQDPRSFIGVEVPSASKQLTFVDSSGAERTARPADISPSSLWLLTGGALLFIVLGGIVFRWSADPMLGRLFLLLTSSFATALVAAPAALHGHPGFEYASSAAALVAGPSLFGLFLWFPRPMRRARVLVSASLLVATSLAVADICLTFLALDIVAIVDQASWFWLMLNLLVGLILLTVRASRRSDRRELAPLLVGTAVGVVPLILLVAVPKLIGLHPLVATEVAAIPAAAIPMSFAYAILRHQVFGLDVLVRRVLLRATAIFMSVIGFLVGWLGLQTTGLPPTEAALVSVAAAGLVMPTVSDWVARRVDAWLYRPLFALRSSTEPLQAAGLETLGAEVTARLRQLLPVQWAACIVHDETTPSDRPSRRLLGADGQIPAWLSEHSMLRQSPTEVIVAPIHRFETGVVLLLAGPLLDGGSLGGIQYEAMRVLARTSGSAFEASLLRESAEDEARFRQGLTDMARDLAAAATVNDVLRCLTTHAERLLGAHAASLWRCGADGEVALLEDETDALKPSAKVVRELVQFEVAHGREREWTVVSEDGTSLAFALDDGGDQPIVCLVRRAYGAHRFGSRDERRARELTQHTSGALRRAAEREILEEQLRHRAFYDSLTGLPNRALFLDRIAHGVARSDRLSQELAVLFIDLDRFKVINDSLGHSAGDQLLVQVGRRLRSCLRESDTIARLGGDEFTVLLEGRSAVADAMQAAERILAVLRAPFTIDGQEAYAAASIGISGGTSIRESGRDLLREADIALYRAKAAGRGRYTLFEPRMNHLPVEHLHLESELHRAIERNELRVHYQPIFALSDGRITGLEALVRWEHPEKGLIPPGHFIPLAEDTGLILPIGKWVLEEACRQMHQWQVSYPGAEDLFVSVNVSARQLQDHRLLHDVEEAVRHSGLNPGHVQLEITESVVMQEPEATVVKLNALKGLGIKLAVDDFGTGYSSLAYLKRFPIDVLKVDRAFVGGLAQGGHDSAIVQTVVSLAKALGLHTTAEGIEERSQWTMLEKLGCDQGQGFVFARPLKAFDVEALLARPHSSASVAA